jgi:hypothetical protein
MRMVHQRVELPHMAVHKTRVISLKNDSKVVGQPVASIRKNVSQLLFSKLYCVLRNKTLDNLTVHGLFGNFTVLY